MAGIALFSEGRSYEENSAIFVAEESKMLTSGLKKCMIYLFYIFQTNLHNNNNNNNHVNCH